MRELQNVVRNIVVLNDRELVSKGDTAAAAQWRPCAPGACPAPETSDSWPSPCRPALPVRPLWLVEKEAIEQAIASCDGNIPKAAALLGDQPLDHLSQEAGLGRGQPGLRARLEDLPFTPSFAKKQGWERALAIIRLGCPCLSARVGKGLA